MNTQNTPVHMKLWHKGFWLMALANLLLTMSVYMLIPVMPLWLMDTENFTATETGLSMGVFGIGLYAMGSMCSYLVQRYRRNVVCIWAVVGQTVCLGVLYYLHGLHSTFAEFWVILLQRFALGAVFGLAQMVLSSTLIIDTCESAQRTEANHSAAWFARFALSLGPLAGLLLWQWVGFEAVLTGAMGCSLAAVLLIRMIDFPFRAPEEQIHLFSLDRFLLLQGSVLFLNLVLVTTVVGLLLAMPLTTVFYGMMMVGFLLALLAQRYVYPDAELKSEVVSGLILLGGALLLLLTRTQDVVGFVAPLLAGLGIGVVGSRFLLFFIKLSRHCQRGTSQSTYFLGWESGLSLGLCLGYALFHGQPRPLLCTALALVIVSLLLYNGFTHRWFILHKNR